MWRQVASGDGFHMMAHGAPSALLWDQGTNSFFVSVRGTSADEITGYWEKRSEGATVVQPLAPVTCTSIRLARTSTWRPT